MGEKTVEAKPVQFINLDAVPGLTEERIQEFLKNVYPDKYIGRSVKSIEFIGASEIIGKSQILGRAETKSFETMTASDLTDDHRTPIKINMHVNGITVESFLETLRHEIGHTVAWGGSLELNNAEQIQMLLEVHERLSASDRYMSSYVERLSASDVDLYANGAKEYSDSDKERIIQYVKSNEYWAEIHREYFKNKASFKHGNPVDYELVKKWTKDSGE